MIIQIKQITSKEDRAKALDIRIKVFVEEQKVPIEMEYDEYDDAESTIHYLAMSYGKPVGTARRITTDEGYKLQRFAVLPQARKKGVGSALVKKVLKDIPKDGKEVFLDSQENAVGLYKKHGFVVEGDSFMDAGIPHFKMVLK
jgi:predicted GNAT family N-acyltransferase